MDKTLADSFPSERSAPQQYPTHVKTRRIQIPSKALCESFCIASYSERA